MTKTSQAFVVFLLALLPAVALAVVEVAGVKFPERVTVDDTPLVLNGAGVRRATIDETEPTTASMARPVLADLSR